MECAAGALALARRACADQPQRLGRLAALVHQHAVKMQRVEIVGLRGEHLTVKRLGLIELTALMQGGGLLQQADDVQ